MTEWVDQAGAPVVPGQRNTWVHAFDDARWMGLTARVFRMVPYISHSSSGMDPEVYAGIFEERPSGEIAIEV